MPSESFDEVLNRSSLGRPAVRRIAARTSTATVRSISRRVDAVIARDHFREMAHTDEVTAGYLTPIPDLPRGARMPAFTTQQLQDIQGFGIAGFRKDNQELIFLRVGDPAGGRRFLGWLQPRIASAWEVGTFNGVFSEIKSRSKAETIGATWVAVLVSAAGYEALGVSTVGLPAGEGTNAFNEGMAKRVVQTGDTGPLDNPEGWLDQFRPEANQVHLLILVASDEVEDLADAVEAITDEASACGCSVVFQEPSHTLPAPLTGHEHFGFKDGLSQPAIDGYDDPPAPNEPMAAPPGEFVLGYPTVAGPVAATTGTLWSNGSFAAFRRLHQDVAAFRAQATAGVPNANPALNPDQTAASMVGRWPSGAPLEVNPIATTPADPGLGATPNAFEFKAAPFSDDDGHNCPQFGHIRKANPRDETTPSPADDPRQHRMIRRGLPYGDPLPAGSGDDGVDRGLHFICVVSDLARQFEFIQSQWLDGPNFPNGQVPPTPGAYVPTPGQLATGPDPAVGERTAGEQCTLVQPSGQHQFTITAQLVRATAGEYFFVPSLTAITAVAGGATQ